MAQHAQEGFLHGIFSIGGIAQNGIGYAIEGAGVLVHQRRDRGVFRALARFLIHRARGNLHPTCGIWPGWCSSRTRRRRRRKCSGSSRRAIVAIRRFRAYPGNAVLLCSQLLSCDLACCAVLIRIADLGPKRARLVLLAFRGIEIGKIQLGHAG